MAVHVGSDHAPTETTAAIIEPLIATFEDIDSSTVPDAFQNMVIARTVCHWSAANKTAVVQIANPSNQYVYFKRDNLLGHIAPVSVAPKQTISAVLKERQRNPHATNSVQYLLTRLIRLRSHLANARKYWSYAQSTETYFPCHPKS